MSQGFVLGPILSNIYLNDLSCFLFCDVCNFVDDLTTYVNDINLAFFLAKLEEHCSIAMKWFENNYMKINSDKCHFFICGNKFQHLWAKISNDIIRETVKPLGITLDKAIVN